MAQIHIKYRCNKEQKKNIAANQEDRPSLI